MAETTRCVRERDILSKKPGDPNNEALTSGEDRIFSSYNLPEWVPEPDPETGFGGGLYRIWIITEWDRSRTTILFPAEY